MSASTVHAVCAACRKPLAVAFPDGVDKVAMACPHCGRAGKYRRVPVAPDAPPPSGGDGIRAAWAATLDGAFDIQASLRADTEPGQAGRLAGLEAPDPRPRAVTSDRSRAASDSADYRFGDVLGRGGMGLVMRARQCAFGRHVAVKVIAPEKAGQPEARAKFLAEAALHGRLDHPNIVPLYDLGRTGDGGLFVAMREIDGDAWSAGIGLMARDDNLDILLRVADAVAFAHSRHIVHLDLKPANVMRGRFGETYLIDWGMAAPTEGFGPDEHLRHPFARGGTPAYMAPEMVRAETARIGPRTDIYLLGAVLYEILTGGPPHRGASVLGCLFAAMRNEAAAPEKDDDEWMAIARKAMATDPGQRYDDVQEFQRAIRRARAHEASRVLAGRASGALALAEVGGDYQAYARAAFGFDEALRLWPGNREAERDGLRARRAYADKAIQRGEYDLAESLVREHESGWGDAQARIHHGRRVGPAAARRGNTLFRAMMATNPSGCALCGGLLGFLVVGMVALLVINRHYARREMAWRAEHRDDDEKFKSARADVDRLRDEADRARNALESERRAFEADRQRAEDARGELERTRNELRRTREALAEFRRDNKRLRGVNAAAGEPP